MSEAGRRGPVHILVVEDQEEIAQMLKDYFEEVRGFKVTLASDGGAAIRMAQREPPDLVLLDINLPILDGFEVLEELKKREIATRVLMCSGHRMDIGTAVQCIKNGACDFVPKPLTLPATADLIERYVLMERTINLNLAKTTPIIDRLIRESVKTEEELESALRENRRLKRQTATWGLVLKAVNIILSVGASILLFKSGVIRSESGITVMLAIFLVLLLIPAHRIQEISGQIYSLGGRVLMSRDHSK